MGKPARFHQAGKRSKIIRQQQEAGSQNTAQVKGGKETSLTGEKGTEFLVESTENQV